ncbi:MAG: hypothetical protein IMZ52_02865 [Actinobacteria bacterium]|nr:hypothetical protein [Actinomycetota bacterium]MBE3114887.1 hypothetical protein [Actinomycetota bacterium]
MALQDRIAKKRELDSIRSKDLGIYFNADGTPKTVISTGKSAIAKFGSTERTEKQLKDFWKYYELDNMVFASINTIAYNTIMCGYQLVSENPKAKQLVQMMFDRMDVDGALLDNVIYGLVCGDSFIEKVKGKLDESTLKKAKTGKFTVSLKTASPFTMQINQDNYGREIDYQQKIGGQLLPTKLTKEDIIHLRFFPKPDSPYGISLLGPSKDSIDKMRDVDESIFNAIQRHTPKYVVTVGTQEEIPPKAVFDRIKTDLEDISSKNEFIVPGVITMTTIDESGVPSVEAYTGTFQSKTLVGLMCPQEAFSLGAGGSEATANVRALMFERFIKSIQHKLETQLRVELINQILVEHGYDVNIVNMRFNSVTDADEERKAKWIGNLFRGFPEGKKPLTRNEVRSLFSYMPVKGGDDDFMESAKGPAIQPAD